MSDKHLRVAPKSWGTRYPACRQTAECAPVCTFFAFPDGRPVSTFLRALLARTTASWTGSS